VLKDLLLILVQFFLQHIFFRKRFGCSTICFDSNFSFDFAVHSSLISDLDFLSFCRLISLSLSPLLLLLNCAKELQLQAPLSFVTLVEAEEVFSEKQSLKAEKHTSGGK
jgi:hypothetical protein